MEDNKIKEIETDSEENNTSEGQVEGNLNSDSSEPDSKDGKFNHEEIDLEKLEGLSDDEAVIELDKMTGQNDKILEKDYLSSLIKQEDRLVYFEVDNIYYNPKKRIFKNRFKMRKDPPVLIVRDDFGNEAQFYLTENLTDELAESLRQVKRAYYGFNNPNDINAPEKFLDKVKYYVKKNPYKIATTIALILFIIGLNLM